MGRSLLQRIEAFLKESDMPPSVFGRHAAKDPRLVSDMRCGREIGQRLNLRIEYFMNMWREQRKVGQVTCFGDLRTRMARDQQAAAVRHQNHAVSVTNSRGVAR